MNKRITYIDICKCLAIFFVVWGHIVQPETERYNFELITLLRSSVYSFHMPLFFFLSGFCFSVDKYNSFKEFFLKKAKGILLPGYVGMMISLVYHSFVNGYDYISYLVNPIRIIKTVFWFNDGDLVYWFLGALFFVECLMYFISKIEMKSKQYFLVGGLFAIATLYQLLRYPLPLSIASGIVCLPFFYAGMQQRIRYLISKELKGNIMVYLLLASFVATILLNYFDSRYIVSIWNGVIANPITFLLKATFGICFAMSASLLISKLRLDFLQQGICYIGKNTIYIYIYHRYFLDWYFHFRDIYFENSTMLRNDFSNLFVSIIIMICISLLVLTFRKTRSLCKRII